MIHDMYVMQVKSPQESKYPWDYYKVVKVMKGEEAFGPITGLCPFAPKRANPAGNVDAIQTKTGIVLNMPVSFVDSSRFASNHGLVSISTHHVTESAVLASKIEQLPDLQGFLKLASKPAWKRVTSRPPT